MAGVLAEVVLVEVGIAAGGLYAAIQLYRNAPNHAQGAAAAKAKIIETLSHIAESSLKNKGLSEAFVLTAEILKRTSSLLAPADKEGKVTSVEVARTIAGILNTDTGSGRKDEPPGKNKAPIPPVIISALAAVAAGVYTLDKLFSKRSSSHDIHDTRRPTTGVGVEGESSRRYLIFPDAVPEGPRREEELAKWRTVHPRQGPKYTAPRLSDGRSGDGLKPIKRGLEDESVLVDLERKIARHDSRDQIEKALTFVPDSGRARAALVVCASLVRNDRANEARSILKYLAQQSFLSPSEHVQIAKSPEVRNAVTDLLLTKLKAGDLGSALIISNEFPRAVEDSQIERVRELAKPLWNNFFERKFPNVSFQSMYILLRLTPQDLAEGPWIEFIREGVKELFTVFPEVAQMYAHDIAARRSESPILWDPVLREFALTSLTDVLSRTSEEQENTPSLEDFLIPLFEAIRSPARAELIYSWHRYPACLKYARHSVT